MDAKKLKHKKGTKPKLTLKLGEILKLIARAEEVDHIQKRGYPDADVRFHEGLIQEEKNLVALYLEKKTEVIFESITDTIGQDVEKSYQCNCESIIEDDSSNKKPSADS